MMLRTWQIGVRYQVSGVREKPIALHLTPDTYCIGLICLTQTCVIQFCVMKNPFEYGRELGTDELVDRQDEIRTVTQTIRQGGKLFLIGPRRFGKTSILRTAEDQLSRKSAVILRFNAENYPSVDQLVAALIAEAARQLKGTVERKGEQVRQFFATTWCHWLIPACFR